MLICYKIRNVTNIILSYLLDKQFLYIICKFYLKNGQKEFFKWDHYHFWLQGSELCSDIRNTYLGGLITTSLN